MAYFQVLGGLILLFLGGEVLLRGTVSISKKFGLSTMLVSIVIVGFGTSAPEFLVSIVAALQEAPKLALGNVVGSNIANVLLILGLSAAIAPITCETGQTLRDAFAVLVASVLLCLLTFTGELSLSAGVAFVTLLVAYLTYMYKAERKTQRHLQTEEIDQSGDIPGPDDQSLYAALFFTLGGILMLAIGAHFLVTGATVIAVAFGVSNAIIGLTIVAVGTSLPELATAIVSAWRGHAGVVVGNVIGSNMFNILGVLGATAIAAPVPLDGRIADIDAWIALGVAALLVLVIWSGRLVSRTEGIVMLIAYTAYLGWTIGLV